MITLVAVEAAESTEPSHLQPNHALQPVSRLVIDLNGYGAAATGYNVRYVDQVAKDGSGQLVPLRGGAKLQIVIKAPPTALVASWSGTSTTRTKQWM